MSDREVPQNDTAGSLFFRVLCEEWPGITGTGTEGPRKILDKIIFGFVELPLGFSFGLDRAKPKFRGAIHLT